MVHLVIQTSMYPLKKCCNAVMQITFEGGDFAQNKAFDTINFFAVPTTPFFPNWKDMDL